MHFSRLQSKTLNIPGGEMYKGARYPSHLQSKTLSIPGGEMYKGASRAVYLSVPDRATLSSLLTAGVLMLVIPKTLSVNNAKDCGLDLHKGVVRVNKWARDEDISRFPKLLPNWGAVEGGGKETAEEEFLSIRTGPENTLSGYCPADQYVRVEEDRRIKEREEMIAKEKQVKNANKCSTLRHRQVYADLPLLSTSHYSEVRSKGQEEPGNQLKILKHKVVNVKGEEFDLYSSHLQSKTLNIAGGKM